MSVLRLIKKCKVPPLRRSRKTSKVEGSRKDWEAEATPKHTTYEKTFKMIYRTQLILFSILTWRSRILVCYIFLTLT